MSVLIGHASIDERGQGRNGQAGDQTGKEVVIRDWYQKNWTDVLRPINSRIAERSAQACEAGCANSNVGYDMNQRNTLHTKAKAVGYNLAKIVDPCECDCSSFMTVCAIAGGVTELEYEGNAPTTSTMVNIFTKTGKYQRLTDKKYLTSDQYLKRGDILVRPGSHTVMVLSNGAATQTSSPQPATAFTYPCRGVDVAAWQTNVDYQKLKSAGVQFAIVKIIRKDNQKDKMFETHYNGFTNANIKLLGCYNYSYATTVKKAKEDAQAVINALAGRKLTVFLDVEDQCQKNLGHTLIDIINAYQKEIESAGLQFAIYSGLSFTKTYLLPYINDLNCKNVWTARYYLGDQVMYINSDLNEAKKPIVPGFNLLGWQYSSKGQIDGYNGNLDLSIMYQPIPQTISQPVVNTPIHTGFCNTHSLRVRNAPNTDGAVLGYLTEGMKVSIYEEKNGWYRISPNEQKWASGKYIKLDS